MKQRRLRTPSLRPSAVVVGLLLVVGLLAVLAAVRLFAPPTTADYRNAQQQATIHRELLGQLEVASGDYAQAVVGSLRVEPDGDSLATDTGDERTVFDATVADFIDSAEQLSGLAATKDKEVRSAVRKVAAESQAVEQMIVALTNDYDDYYRTYSTCIPVVQFTPAKENGVTADRYESVSADCLKQLATLKKAQSKELRAYATELTDIIESTATVYESAAKNERPNHAATIARLQSRMNKLDPLTTIQQIMGDSFSTASVDALITLLERRQKS